MLQKTSRLLDLVLERLNTGQIERGSMSLARAQRVLLTSDDLGKTAMVDRNVEQEQENGQ